MHRVDVEKKPSLEDRVAALEAKVGALTAMVEKLANQLALQDNL